MNVNELKESKFLKRSDVGDGTIVTITGVSRENVAKEGAPEELKWILHVEEFDKGLVLNSTNGQLIAQALKSEESDDWVGGKVVLYDDPSVSFGGKLVGGIRVRAVPKANLQPVSRPATQGVSTKATLKSKFKAHPKFGKELTAESINGYLLQNYSVKLDDLDDNAAKDALANFDVIVEACLDDLPFN
jgi:hypothetical protein